MKSNFQNTNNTSFACSAELVRAESSMPNYNNYILQLLTSGVKNISKSLDFGAGIGSLSKIFYKKYGVKPECYEIDRELAEYVETLGFNVYVDRCSIEQKYNLIFSSNVLEHIEDDVESLSWAHSSLVVGGTLAIYVPAFQALYSNFDRFAGHYRRYDKEDLVEKLKRVGFAIERYRYVDSIGFIVWYLLRNKNITNKSSITSDSALRFYDKYIFPISLLFDACFGKYFGKNIYIRAVKL